MDFKLTLTDGKVVQIKNPDGTSWTYEVYSMEGDLLGTVFTGGDDGTDSPALKPYEAELVSAIYNHNRPEL